MPITVRRLAVLGLLLVAAFGMGAAVSSRAEAPAPVVRVALLPQWVIQQHRSLPALAEAIEGGVVDRTVFAWQRGVIQRQALVSKPIRVVPDPASLGGRGRFDLTVRPSTGRAAWTEIEVHQSSPSADDVLLLEIGGERNTITQVLETLLIAEPGRPLAEIPLARPALVAGAGVPVVASTFDAPLPPAMAQRFRPGSRSGPPGRPPPALGRAERGPDVQRACRYRAVRQRRLARGGPRVPAHSGRQARSRRARDRPGVEGPDAPERPERRVPASLVPAAPRHSLTVAMRPRFLPVARRVA